MATTTTDYDAPRVPNDEAVTDSLEMLKERRHNTASDLDTDGDGDGDFELPGFDILDDDLTAPVIPMRASEFRCSACFLVLHHTMHARVRTGNICHDCA